LNYFQEPSSTSVIQQDPTRRVKALDSRSSFSVPHQTNRRSDHCGESHTTHPVFHHSALGPRGRRPNHPLGMPRSCFQPTRHTYALALGTPFLRTLALSTVLASPKARKPQAHYYCTSKHPNSGPGRGGCDVDPRVQACRQSTETVLYHGYLTPKAEIERRMQRRMSPEETTPSQPASLTQEGLHEAKHYS
jgi:hypothetical protein